MFFGKSRILTFRPHPPTRRRRRLVPFPLPPGFPRQSPFWKVGKKTRLFSPGPSLRPSSPPEAFSCNTRASARKIFFSRVIFPLKNSNFPKFREIFRRGKSRNLSKNVQLKFSKLSRRFSGENLRKFPQHGELHFPHEIDEKGG